jgi:transcriptional regulator with XRE-family HTH domain
MTVGPMTPLVLNLRSHREKAGLSQAKLAKVVGVRQATISDLEIGKSRRVELDLLERLAKALGVKAAALFEQMPDKPKRKRG